MPLGNRRGPEGQGPRTGRAAGYCAGNDGPGYLTATMRRLRRGIGGGGRGLGFRFGWGIRRPTRGPR